MAGPTGSASRKLSSARRSARAASARPASTARRYWTRSAAYAAPGSWRARSSAQAAWAGQPRTGGTGASHARSRAARSRSPVASSSSALDSSSACARCTSRRRRSGSATSASPRSSSSAATAVRGRLQRLWAGTGGGSTVHSGLTSPGASRRSAVRSHPLGPEEGPLQPRAFPGGPSPIGSPAVPVDPCLQRGERAVRPASEATRQLGVAALTPGQTQQEPEVRGGVHAGPAQPRVERLQRLEGRSRASPEEAAAGPVGAEPLESGPEALEAIGPHRHGSLAPGREQCAAEGAEAVGERSQLGAEVLGTARVGAGPGGLQLRVEPGELVLLEHQRREAARDQ